MAQSSFVSNMKDIENFADIRFNAGHDEFCAYSTIVQPSIGNNRLQKQSQNFSFGGYPKTVDEFNRLLYVGGQSSQ